MTESNIKNSTKALKSTKSEDRPRGRRDCDESVDITPGKINMEPENHWVVEENRLPKVHVQVPCSISQVYV